MTSSVCVKARWIFLDLIFRFLFPGLLAMVLGSTPASVIVKNGTQKVRASR